MVSECDYLVTVLPQTPGTIKFVNAEVISHMKSSAVFINIGRGTTVDEQALIKGKICFINTYKFNMFC